jgi:hypothetical protein
VRRGDRDAALALFRALTSPPRAFAQIIVIAAVSVVLP